MPKEEMEERRLKLASLLKIKNDDLTTEEAEDLGLCATVLGLSPNGERRGE